MSHFCRTVEFNQTVELIQNRGFYSTVEKNTINIFHGRIFSTVIYFHHDFY